MKINLEINNTTESPVEEGFFEAAVDETFTELNFDFLKNVEIEISIALVSKEEIRKLNKNYRKYDSVTDVLSFPEFESEEELRKGIEKESGAKDGEEKKVFLGELILCYDDIREYAQKEEINFEKELAKVVSHGTLHLLGFEHGEKMFTLQQNVADKLIK